MPSDIRPEHRKTQTSPHCLNNKLNRQIGRYQHSFFSRGISLMSWGLPQRYHDVRVTLLTSPTPILSPSFLHIIDILAFRQHHLPLALLAASVCCVFACLSPARAPSSLQLTCVALLSSVSRSLVSLPHLSVQEDWEAAENRIRQHSKTQSLNTKSKSLDIRYRQNREPESWMKNWKVWDNKALSKNTRKTQQPLVVGSSSKVWVSLEPIQKTSVRVIISRANESSTKSRDGELLSRAYNISPSWKLTWDESRSSLIIERMI